MTNISWQSYLPSIPTIILSFASGFGGGILSVQKSIAELDKRTSVIEAREIEFERGADRRESSIRDLNAIIRDHEIESQRRYVESQRKK